MLKHNALMEGSQSEYTAGGRCVELWLQGLSYCFVDVLRSCGLEGREEEMGMFRGAQTYPSLDQPHLLVGQARGPIHAFPTYNRSVPQADHCLSHHLLRAERCGHGRLAGRILLRERCGGFCDSDKEQLPVGWRKKQAVATRWVLRAPTTLPLPPHCRGQPRPCLADGRRAGGPAHRLLDAGRLKGLGVAAEMVALALLSMLPHPLLRSCSSARAQWNATTCPRCCPQILAPAKVVIENTRGTMDAKERDSHLRAWGIKKVGAVANSWAGWSLLGAGGIMFVGQRVGWLEHVEGGAYVLHIARLSAQHTLPRLPATQWVGFGLSLLPFAGMLLVLSAERDERNVAGVRF